MKRIFSLVLALSVLIPLCFTPVFACDDEQTNKVITAVLFGDSASSFESDAHVKELLNAVFLCSEQYGGNGREQWSALKKDVWTLPSFSKIQLSNESDLILCTHQKWSKEPDKNAKIKNNRKAVLQRTVNDVFDYGIFNNLLGSKCDSFASLLYYLHILSDYLVDNLENTRIVYNGHEIPAYSGEPYVMLNNNVPCFTNDEEQTTNSTFTCTKISLNRSGACSAVINSENVLEKKPPRNLSDPVGWPEESQGDRTTINGELNNNFWDRSHIIGRQFIANDSAENLFTGTMYLNQGVMKEREEAIANYLLANRKSHVLYRVTPVYQGENLIPSGVQMEAYSLEDAGKGICFNIYCYNVQPGVSINYYAGGTNSTDDTINSDIIPFAELVNEITKACNTLFDDQKDTALTQMNSKVKTLLDASDDFNDDISMNDVNKYNQNKEYEFQYYSILKKYLPELLAKEKFFSSVFPVK